MYKIIRILFFVVLSFVVDELQAADYYCDPVSGSQGNLGTEASPWGSLEGVVFLQRTNPGFQTAIESGDVIHLMNGNHGAPYILDFAFTSYVTVVAYAGHNPVINSVQINNSPYWAFDGIIFGNIDLPEIKEFPYFQSFSNSHHTKIENCIVKSADDISTWTKAIWYDKVHSGIQMRDDYSTVNNNLITNIYHALEVSGDNASVVGNTIDNFAADGIRGLGSNSTYENNVVRDCYINDYAIQHDDAFQSFDLSADPKISNVVIRNNKFLLFADPVTQFIIDNDLIGTKMQGVIITDGYADNWVVENNLVVNTQDHGISLYGARNCRIQNNTVVQSPLYDIPATVPRIYIDKQNKTGQLNFDNVIRNNICAVYTTWTYDSSTLVENNIDIDQTDYNNYKQYFIDYVAGDFHLISSSPAIEAGVNTQLYSTDLDGNPRLAGTIVDCGVYEYDSNLSITLEDKETYNVVSIYPNPIVDNNINISLEGVIVSGDLKISIYDATGVEVFNKNFRKSEKINLSLPSRISKGLYFLNIRDENSLWSKKIIIK